MDAIAIAAGAGAGFLVGIAAGFLLRRTRSDLPSDWKMRLRSRDDDLQAAEAAAAEAMIQMEALTAEVARLGRAVPTPPAPAAPAAPEHDGGDESPLDGRIAELAAGLTAGPAPGPAASDAGAGPPPPASPSTRS